MSEYCQPLGVLGEPAEKFGRSLARPERRSLLAYARIMPMEISPRLTRWVNREFPKGSAEMVLDELRELPEEVIGGQDPERVQASLVIRTAGDWYQFQQVAHACQVGLERRPRIVGAGLGDKDWPSHVDALLGTYE